MMATLYDVSIPAISQHLKCIYADNELERVATIKQYLTVQTEGYREVQRKVVRERLRSDDQTAWGVANDRYAHERKSSWLALDSRYSRTTNNNLDH